MSEWNSFWVILCKEIKDNLRDKRTIMTILFSAIIGPLALFGLLWFAEKTVKEETDLVHAEPIELAVVGAELAPNLMRWLEQHNFEIVAAPEDPEQAVRSGDMRMVLSITNDFVERFKEGRTAPVLIIHDSSISGLEKIGYEVVKRAIGGYSAQVSSLRLQARGVSPQIMQSISVNTSDVATAESRNAQVLTMLPYLIIIFIMVGGMYLAIDTTAGERENGSLEPLLTQPAHRSTVMLAKLGATIVFSALTLLIVLLGLALAFKYMPIESISLSIDVAKVAVVFIACIPFVFVGCALMVLLASFTKSYKEAQSYLGMVMIIPSMPLILLAFLSPEQSISNMWVPSLSQGLIIIETFKGEMISPSLIALSMLSSAAIAAVLAFAAVKLYQRERILG